MPKKRKNSKVVPMKATLPKPEAKKPPAPKKGTLGRLATLTYLRNMTGKADIMAGKVLREQGDAGLAREWSGVGKMAQAMMNDIEQGVIPKEDK